MHSQSALLTYSLSGQCNWSRWSTSSPGICPHVYIIDSSRTQLANNCICCSCVNHGLDLAVDFNLNFITLQPSDQYYYQPCRYFSRLLSWKGTSVNPSHIPIFVQSSFGWDVYVPLPMCKSCDFLSNTQNYYLKNLTFTKPCGHFAKIFTGEKDSKLKWTQAHDRLHEDHKSLWKCQKEFTGNDWPIITNRPTAWVAQGLYVPTPKVKQS